VPARSPANPEPGPPSVRVHVRDLWVALESVHAVTYFAPACRHALRDAGLKGFWAGYFAGRAAPLGRVDAGPVTAAFYNFHPDMVAAAVPGCWEVVAPDRVSVIRAGAAVTALRDLCTDDALEGLVAVLPLLRRAAGASNGDGRILAGANRELWASVRPELEADGTMGPDIDVAEAWQACTTLREHRGDGHVAALVAQGLSGLEAHVLASGTAGTPVEILRDNRGWTDADWEAGRRGLVGRGLVHADGAASTEGRTRHALIEQLTDGLAEPAYATLDEAEIAALYAALRRCAGQIQAASLLPFPNPMGLPRL
jgi:hypothetical protein